jgi:hypothetical protein
MTAFIVITDTSDWEEEPTIVGPFPDRATATEWMDKFPDGQWFEPDDGGYRCTVVVDEQEGATSPTAYLEESLEGLKEQLTEGS